LPPRIDSFGSERVVPSSDPLHPNNIELSKAIPVSITDELRVMGRTSLFQDTDFGSYNGLQKLFKIRFTEIILLVLFFDLYDYV
jgi:hypothetical protein